MISKAVIAKAAEYRQAFQSAQPFKHVCIDGSRTREAAHRLCAERPVTGIALKGLIPEHEIAVDDAAFRFSQEGNGGFDFTCPVAIAASQGGDQRPLAYHLTAIEFATER